jgi:hypothetical protein
MFSSSHSFGKLILLLLWSDSWLVSGKSCSAWLWVMQFLPGAGEWQLRSGLSVNALYMTMWMTTFFGHVLRTSHNTHFKVLYFIIKQRRCSFHFCSLCLCSRHVVAFPAAELYRLSAAVDRAASCHSFYVTFLPCREHTKRTSSKMKL